MSRLLRSSVLCLALCMVTAYTHAGSLYLTGHDVLLHGGQNGYWRVILDFLRGAGTASEIPEASYDIAFLNTGGSIPAGWAGTITSYNPEVLDDAGWAEVFSRDVIVVPWAPNFSAAARAAFLARSAQLATFFNAGGDLWMNSSSGASDYYTVLPASVLSTGTSISGSTGFTATAAGVAIGITDSMINGFPTHNNFTTVASALTVFEERSGEIISIGISDATITGTGIDVGTGGNVPIPTLPTWALLLLAFIVAGVAYVGLGKRFSRS